MNSSGFLPSINGATSPSFGFTNDEYRDDMRTTQSKFEQSLDKFSTITYPPLNANDTIKNRLGTMESISMTQAELNRASQESFLNLSGDLHATENNLKDLLLQMQSAYDQKLANLKKEYDHRFELQSSENKRLQNHVATLKSDSYQLERKLVSFSRSMSWFIL